MKKKLMLLGGIRYLLPVIETAHKMGVYVITADYLPDNIAHKYSDEYVNVSIIDREAVLKVAQEKKIDGIMSFGVDPGVVTAAYVADRMGLPYPPLESCEILQNKDKFRDFLQANGFNCPWHRSFATAEEAMEFFRSTLRPTPTPTPTSTPAPTPTSTPTPTPTPYTYFPCIVKPVDSAGSKGCSRVDRFEDLAQAVEYARSESHNGRIIIEQFLEKVGPSSDTDCFTIDDELVFASFNCQHFDATAPNPYAPAGFSWPSVLPASVQSELRSELQRLMKLLHMGSWIYNVESRLASDGKPYIMEVSPRGGGNRLSEMLKFACGQDLIANNIRVALGEKPVPMADPVYDGTWAEVVVHSNKTGEFQGLEIADDFEGEVIQLDLWAKPGDRVSEFTGANQTIGTLVLKFSSHEKAEADLLNVRDWVHVKVKELDDDRM